MLQPSHDDGEFPPSPALGVINSTADSCTRFLQKANDFILGNEFLKCMHLTDIRVSVHIDTTCSSCRGTGSISSKYVGGVK